MLMKFLWMTPDWKISPVQRGLGSYTEELMVFVSWNARICNLIVQHVKSCV